MFPSQEDVEPYYAAYHRYAKMIEASETKACQHFMAIKCKIYFICFEIEGNDPCKNSLLHVRCGSG
jgi:hypothetical protein